MSQEEEDASRSKEIQWGKTSNGKVFKVPRTKDMVDNLFATFPPRPSTHRISELVTLFTVFLQSLLFIYMTVQYRVIKREEIPWNIKLYTLCVFLVFRTAYNAGLGWLLKKQSETMLFTRFCRHLFDKEEAEKSEWGKWLYQVLKRQLSMKMESEYDFESVPVEFNTWLVFRQLVDFILINDFTAYMVFTMTFLTIPETMSTIDWVRYTLGFALIAFNYWVKVDAHRVVKDFAWCKYNLYNLYYMFQLLCVDWGDFFFLIDADLTFDGVFEMCVHPMYSVGYLGFYGLSMITNSYVVFFTSVAAHAAQFLFLYKVEEPHIQKTYSK